jgi:SepF-like predicted cell division protein (DUF552 family)
MLRRSFEYNYQISNKIKAKQSKAKQSKAKQSKAKQNKMKTPRTPKKKVYKIKRISTNDLKKLQNMFRSITNIVQIS